jgi:hypothetical protein
MMHDKNIYTSIRLKDEIVSDIAKVLMEGFATDLPPQLCIKFERLVCERMKQHTKSFTERHLIIFEPDGTAKKSERFEKMWDSREEHVSILSNIFSSFCTGSRWTVEVSNFITPLHYVM